MTTVAALLHTVHLELDPPGYVLKTTINPLPGPEAHFHIRVREQRETEVSRLRPARSLTGLLSGAFPLLNRELVTQITPKVALLTYAPGTTIIRQGDPPDKFYIILKGEVEVVREQSGRDARWLASLTEGNFFGEIGLLQGIPRTATVRAHGEEEVLLMALDREDFLRMVVESDLTSQEIASLMRQRVMRTRLAATFPGLSDEVVAKVAAESELVQYTPGVSIMCEGDPAEKFFLLTRGVCDVMSSQSDGEDKVLSQLSAGEYFGEIGLLQGEPQRFTVRAASGGPVEVMELGSATFTTLMAESETANETITEMMYQRLAKLQEQNAP
jgi:CRP-like cAMP-binding protein